MVQALDWCIETAAFLSSTDMLGSAHQLSATGVDEARQLKSQLDQFLASCPAPHQEVLTQLQHLSEHQDWAQEPASFANHRVQEVNDKIGFINSILEDRVKARETPANGNDSQESPTHSSPQQNDVINVGQVVKMRLQYESETDGPEGGANGRGQDGGEKIRTWDSEENLLQQAKKGVVPESVTLRRPRKSAADSSLHYDDVGAGHAMMLLKSVADQADAKLKPNTEGESRWEELRVWSVKTIF